MPDDEQEMPRRSVSQETGDAAAPRFQVVLEPSYIFRSETPDFGIDGEVEEFIAGRATGLRYKVQLKSTDNRDLRASLRVSIPLATANYWRAQDLPVLLVRYHRPTDTFYVRWFHSFDPYEGGVGQDAITFRWAEQDAWTAGKAEALGAEARAFLQLRSNRIALPFPFGVLVVDGAHGLTTTELRIAARSAARRRPDVVRILDRDAQAGEGRLIVAADRLSVDLGGVTSAALHLPGGKLRSAGMEGLVTDLLALAAIAFAHVGQADLAGRLASSFLAKSELLRQPEAPWALSSAMARARQVREAMELADRIDSAASRDTDDDSALWFTLLIRFHAGSLSPSEEEFAVGVMQRRIDRRRQRGDRQSEAQECVNLGNFFRSRAKPMQAVEFYDRALDVDPTYGSRAHYWHDKAGVLFGSHRYPEAAEAYARAIELRSDGLAPALQADALFFAGRYAEARALWEHFVSAEPIRARAAEYELKLDLVKEIVDDFGISCQQRRTPANAQSPLLGGDEPPAIEEARAVAIDALQSDALDARAWDLLAWTDLVDGNLEAHARHCLAVALLLESSDEAWARAVMVRLGLLETHSVAEMLVTGERLTDDRLLGTLTELARDRIPEEEREAFLVQIEELFRSIPADPAGGFALRFLRRDGGVTEIPMPSAEHPLP
jgi:tetratricopeptide (TPR) repeat protein